MDLPNPDRMTVNMESVTAEEGGCELPHADIDIDLSDVKQECLDYSVSPEKTAGKNYTEIVLAR